MRKSWTARPSLLRRGSRLIVGCFTALCLIGALPSVGHAASANYCGYLIPSTTTYSTCASPYLQSSWTYTSASYQGGGTISNLCTMMIHHPSKTYYDWEACARPGSFANICYFGYLGTNYGVLRQHDSGDPRHTIYGRVDNSPNHSSCFYETLKT